MHKRKTIKEKLKDLLEDGLSCNVYKARYLAIDENTEFPACCIYTPEEDSEKMKSSEGYTRKTNVVVAGYVSGYDEIEIIDGETETTNPEDIEDKLDDMSTDIENILLKQYVTLDGTILDLQLTKTRYFINSDGDKIVGTTIMEWDAIYHDKVAT